MTTLRGMYMSEGMQWEIHDLWNRHYEERDQIIREEMDKDQDEYPDSDEIYEENYFDHWRVEELSIRTQKEEDEIYTRYEGK